MNEHILEEAVNGIDEKLLGKHMERRRIFSIQVANQKSKGGTNMNPKSAQNKWFYAFIVAAVLLLAAAVAIVVISGNQEQTQIDQPFIEEGSETGVYYYGVEQGEVVLSLNSGNRFTLSGPEINKSGEYTVAGTTITLDFARDEDGTTTATIEKDYITLNWNNAVMKLLKKVSYTLSFNSNGGSAVEAVSVINGKFAANPADPAKDGSVFLGWFADEALSEAFLFSAMPITADTTVYAKWADKVPGQDEYTVEFDLGYDAPAPVSITTVGGKLYFSADYTEPTRNGYTFAGWYVSMYDDGAKLTYEVTEGSEINENATLYAVWNDNAANVLDAPAVSVSGNTISWYAVDGANAYAIVITDAEGNKLAEASVGTTTYTYNFASAEPGDYTISVVAKGATESEPAVRYYANKALGKVSRFEVIDSTLIFNAVENAQKYLITIDCGNDAHEHTQYDNGNSTVYHFKNCTMQEGGIKFTVTAVANGYASTTSKTFTYERNLDKVETVLYDEETATFSWAAVPGAAKYRLEILAGNDAEKIVVDNYATTFCVHNLSGNITISVVPVTDGYNSPEPTTATIEKTTPATPDGITIVDRIISWNDVGVENYIVRINGAAYQVNGATSLNLIETDLSMTLGAKYTITVQAVGATEVSRESEPVEAYYFTMGKVYYSNNTVSWDPVIGATSFEISVNGETFVVQDANSATVKLNKSGVNTIGVRATDFAADAPYSTVDVFAYAVVYDTRTADGATITEYVAKGDKLSLPEDITLNGFDFGGWYNSPNAAAGNGAQYTDSVFNSVDSFVLYANWVPKSYNITIVGVDPATMNGAANDEKYSVVYTKDFSLPVMTTTNTEKSNFAGWYTGPDGFGTKLTDHLGNSVAPYGVPEDSFAYPHFTSGIIFELQDDSTYAVKKGTDINSVPVVTIPATYNGIPVTTILESGFYNCDNLVEINIPDSIRLVGQGAFNNCDALEAINIYEAETDFAYDVVYASYDGALIFNDEASGYTYLEVFPRAKKGTFVIPEEVDIIRNRAFNYASISSLTISKEVVSIGEYTFANCYSLSEIIFEEGRTNPISVATTAFDGCYAVSYIKLPAFIKTGKDGEEAVEFDLTTLDSLTGLETIEVEDADGAYFSDVEGMLCSALGDALLYCPKAYTGIKGVLSIPAGINTIGPKTFQNRNSLIEIVIPNFVTEIGEAAFYGCRNVSKITFQGNRSRDLVIGNEAFKDCDNAREVIFEGNSEMDTGTITVGRYSFSDMGNLRTVVVNERANIVELGMYSFMDNLKLQSFTVAENATLGVIGDCSFQNCESLTNFIIHATTTKIGHYAFKGCKRLGTIVFAPNGQDIDFGTYVFENCVSLTSIELPATVQKFDGSAFAGCDSLRNIIVDPNNAYLTAEGGVLFDKAKTEVMFYPRAIDDPDLSELPWDTITTIGDAVFKDNVNITSVNLTKNVTKIGDNAFNGCVNLTSVTFEEGGTGLTVGKYAFANCQQLTAIALPACTTELDEGIFHTTPLAAFVIPENVTRIGQDAFMYTNLTSINIPAKVEVIGDGAFAYSKLTSVTFEEGTAALVIGDVADIEVSYNFESPTYSIYSKAKVFPEDYYDKVTGVFMGTQIESVKLPARTTSIGALAFCYITTLKTVDISANSDLNVIGDGAFYGTGLTSIKLENTKLTQVGEFAFSESKLTGVKFPNTIALIEKYAFADMGTVENNKLTPSLVSVEFAAGGTSQLTIRDSVFLNSAFTKIDLPANLFDCMQEIVVGGASGATVSSFFKIFEGNYVLSEINVAEGCERFASVDGVFYEKDAQGNLATLIFCPPAKTGEYTIPKTVTLVAYRAFYLSQLSKVTFENYDETDENYGQPILKIGNANKSGLYNYSVFGGNVSVAKTARSVLKGYNANVKASVSNATTPAASTIIEINFPSHLALIASFGVQGLNTAGGSINFHKDTAIIELYQYAMPGNNGVTTLHLPRVSSLGSTYTFTDNKTLKEITFAEGSTFTTMPNQAFRQCIALESITIPASVEKIDTMCFYICYALKEVTFAEGSKIKSIGDQAFENTALTEFVIPDTVTTMGTNIFQECNIKKVTIGLGMTSIAGTTTAVFQNCPTIEEFVVVPNHPTLMAVEGVVYDLTQTILFAFPSAKDPTGYKMPDTVKEIATYAFYQFGGTSITLAPNLTTIGYGAFQNSKLTSIVIPATVTKVDSNAFRDSVGNKCLASVIFEAGSQLTEIGMYAFAGSIIESIVLPDSINKLGASVFYNIATLKSIMMPAALTTMGNSVFSGCSNLEEIIFQDKLVSIGNYTFSNCKKLTSIVIPASVTTIGNSAFMGCSALETVTFAEGSMLTTINNMAFYNCSSLKEIVLPESVATLGTNVFYGNTSLETLDASKSQITTLRAVFTNCKNLTTVLLPETLTSIAANTFKGFTKIQSIVIPAAVTSLGNGAFDGCTGLTSVEFGVGSKLTTLGTATFRNTTSLTSIVLPETLTVLAANVFENSGLTSVEIPATVTEIDTAAFKGCAGLTELSIPATVTDINDQAFQNCVNLQTLTLAEGLEYLGADAFGNCAKIKEIVVPRSVLRMGGNPFANCTGLTNFEITDGNEAFVVDSTGVLYDANMRTVIFYPAYLTSENYKMPNTVFELANGAFAGSQLKTVVISDNIKVIPEGCFKDSALLESITIPLSITKIEAEAFINCASLNNVVIPASCTSIGNSAFENCKSLTNFDFGTRNTKLSVGTALFRGCSSMTELIIPADMTRIPDYMFAGTAIKNLIIPDTITDLGGSGIFMECVDLATVQFPAEYSNGLGYRAFYGCVSLKAVELPDGLYYMGIEPYGTQGETFMNCTALETVKLSKKLVSMGNSTFENCTSLKAIDLAATNMNLVGDYCFRNCTSLKVATLRGSYGKYVFEGCVNLAGTLTMDAVMGGEAGMFKGCNKITAIHIGGFEQLNSSESMFIGWTSNQKVYFDQNSAKELFDSDKYGCFDGVFSNGALKGCEARIFDRDGYEIIYDSETGALIMVLDADGNQVVYDSETDQWVKAS